VSIKRWAARRDENESLLVEFAKAKGWMMWKLDAPCDWLALLPHTGIWRPVEIKGKDGAFTDKQTAFIESAKQAGGDVLVWRTEMDVESDTKQLRGWG
jgi:hypothetical protein